MGYLKANFNFVWSDNETDDRAHGCSIPHLMEDDLVEIFVKSTNINYVC